MIKLLRNIAVEQTYKDMDKFKIVLVYTDGLTETMIGVGKPIVSDGFLSFSTPDGLEIIRNKEVIKGFNISKFKE